MPPLLAVRLPRLLTPVPEPSQILLCLLHLSSHLTRTSWQYIRLVSTNILLSVPTKEAICAWWMDLVSLQKWFSIWMQHFSEISLPLRHQHRLFSALWFFKTSICAGWLQRVQRVSAHVLGTQPDQSYSSPVLGKQLDILQPLPAMLLLGSYQKKNIVVNNNNSRCSCHILYLDLVEVLKAYRSMHLLLKLETIWVMKFKKFGRKWAYIENSFHHEDSHAGVHIAWRGWGKDRLQSFPAQLSCNTTIHCYITDSITLQLALKTEAILKD